jgi:hypothetical protein
MIVKEIDVVKGEFTIVKIKYKGRTDAHFQLRLNGVDVGVPFTRDNSGKPFSNWGGTLNDYQKPIAEILMDNGITNIFK